MKKINKLVLNQLAKKELTQRQQGLIKGGGAGTCPCGCCYGNSGGSDTVDNGEANCQQGKYSDGCPNGAYSICF